MSILTIENAVLEREIIQYVKEVKIPNVKSKYPYLIINDLEADTVEYRINFFLSPYFFEHYPVAFFVKIKNIVVPVVIKGLMFKDEFLFELKKDVIMNYVRVHFPKEYAYYEENNDYPPPTTAREVIWILTFKGKKFLKKVIITE